MDKWGKWSKMAMQEDPELTSSHRHTRSTAAYGAASSEKALEMSWKAFRIKLEIGHIDGVREARMESCHEPHP